MTVRVVARRDVITADVIRLQQVAEQVSMEGEGPTLVVIPMILFAAKQRELKRMSIIFQPCSPLSYTVRNQNTTLSMDELVKSL